MHPGGLRRPLRQEKRRRVVHRGQAIRSHLEDPDLVGRAESVLGGPQDPVAVLAVPLEIDHRVHEVLQGPRARQAPLLGHVADQPDADLLALGHLREAAGHLAHLAQAARGGFEGVAPDGLDRVHDDQRRASGWRSARAPPPGRSRRPGRGRGRRRRAAGRARSPAPGTPRRRRRGPRVPGGPARPPPGAAAWISRRPDPRRPGSRRPGPVPRPGPDPARRCRSAPADGRTRGRPTGAPAGPRPAPPGRAPAPDRPPGLPISVRLPHAPQSGQRPSQRGAW